MTIEIIPCSFTVCKVEDYSQTDLSDPFCFIGHTDAERSLVCRTEKLPPNTVEAEHGWRAFRVVGVLDFSLIGILARISSLLAEAKIGIFAVSTFNTDYILTKEEQFGLAVETLKKNGFTVI